MIETNSEEDFRIERATFFKNMAYSSTIMLIKTSGTISGCSFEDNKAEI